MATKKKEYAMFDAPHFHDENEARKHLEAIRWPNGPVCPHCGSVGDHYRLEGTGGVKGKKARPGLLKCKDCREQFSVTVGTVFEHSKIPLTKWLLATHLMCSSKKGISSHQIHRTLGVTYKTAWFMTHRIREAMAPAKDAGPIGGPGKTVEADETYLAKSPKTRKPKDHTLNARNAPGVMSLMERGGNVRSLTLTEKTVREHLTTHLHEHSRLVTDGSQMYKFQVVNHESVDHSKFEWARGDVHTNTLPSYCYTSKEINYFRDQFVSLMRPVHTLAANISLTVHAMLKAAQESASRGTPPPPSRT